MRGLRLPAMVLIFVLVGLGVISYSNSPAANSSPIKNLYFWIKHNEIIFLLVLVMLAVVAYKLLKFFKKR